MTIHDRRFAQATDDDENDASSSQQGCEKLPALKAEAARAEEFIERARDEIERIEGELRALRAQPGSPARDRELTRLADTLKGWYNSRGLETRKLSRLTDEIRDLESRCIRKT